MERGNNTMKVYQVVMDYFDGDHEHGSYRSPLFVTRELAEQFKQAVYINSDSDKEWWTDSWHEREEPYIITLEILDELPEVLKDARDYRHITYT